MRYNQEARVEIGCRYGAGTRIRVISARDMSRKERARYAQES